MYNYIEVLHVEENLRTFMNVIQITPLLVFVMDYEIILFFRK